MQINIANNIGGPTNERKTRNENTIMSNGPHNIKFVGDDMLSYPDEYKPFSFFANCDTLISEIIPVGKNKATYPEAVKISISLKITRHLSPPFFSL
jgi:hypothetical protein